MPIMLDQVSETAAKLLSDFERHMLDPAGEEALESGGAGVYQDSALEDASSLMLLAARLWRGGMLTETSELRHTVSLFTVVKKVVFEKESAVEKSPRSQPDRWTTVQRLIFDNRRGNLLWRTPPWVPLGGPGPFSMIDASRVTEQDVRITAATGDVANWYYRLALPPKLASYFGLAGGSTEALRKHLVKEG